MMEKQGRPYSGWQGPVNHAKEFSSIDRGQVAVCKPGKQHTHLSLRTQTCDLVEMARSRQCLNRCGSRGSGSGQ